MIPDIGNPERDAEAAMLVPAGAGLTAPSWYGKKPGRHVAPLTDEWAIAAMQPKPQPDGSILRTLTPPEPGGWRIGYVVIGIAFIVSLGAVFTYPLWRQ